MPSQRNISEPFDFTSSAYTEPTFPVANQNAFLGQELPNLTGAPPGCHFTAPSSNAQQAAQPGSYTQPSFRATSITCPSQRETQTETSVAPRDTNIEMSTLKPLEMNDFVNGDYGLPAFDNDSAVHGTGSQFNGS